MEGDPQIKISADIDASGATAGAAEVVRSVNDIGEAAESAAPKIDKMVEEAGGLRESTKLGRELFETLKGGDESIAGLTGILRYVLISSEALGPLGPLAPAVAGLSLALTSVWAAHSAESEKAKEKVKGDLDESTKDAQAFAAAYVTALKNVLAAQTDIEDSDKRQLEALMEKQRLTTAQIRLNEEEATEKARQQYLVANGNATTEAERKRAKEAFEAEKEDIKNRSTVASAQANLQFKNEDVGQAEKTLADLRAARAANVGGLNDAQDRQAFARNFLSANGVKVDDKGVASATIGGQHIDDLVSAFKERIEQSQTEANSIRQNLASNTYLPKDVDAAKEQLEKYQKVIDQSDYFLDQIRGAINNRSAYDDASKELNPKIKQSDNAIDAQETTVADLKNSIPQLTQAVNNAVLAQQNDATQRKQDTDWQAKVDADRKAFEDRQANRDKDLSDLEAKLKAAQDPVTKANLERQRGDIQGASIRDKAENEFRQGKIDQNQLDAELEKAKNSGANANTQASSQLQAAAKRATSETDRANNKELEEAVRSATEALKATGNKGLIESFSKMAAGLDLQQRASLLIADLATQVGPKFQSIEERLTRAERAVQSISNTHHS